MPDFVVQPSRYTGDRADRFLDWPGCLAAQRRKLRLQAGDMRIECAMERIDNLGRLGELLEPVVLDLPLDRFVDVLIQRNHVADVLL
jgi:hypothetical protein